jgi:hypothetical protein
VAKQSKLWSTDSDKIKQISNKYVTSNGDLIATAFMKRERRLSSQKKLKEQKRMLMLLKNAV